MPNNTTIAFIGTSFIVVWNCPRSVPTDFFFSIYYDLDQNNIEYNQCKLQDNLQMALLQAKIVFREQTIAMVYTFKVLFCTKTHN